jgi:DNA-binding GntR family transcriptional regulator
MQSSPPRLALAKRRVLSDEVTDDLREAIVTHELEPGRKLSEDALAVQLGVSRGPVREALMRLAGEGLITIERHRGARVASWNRTDIEEIFSMRSALESLAIEWACKNATESDIREMEKSLTEYKKLPMKKRSPKEVSRLDLEFHSALFLASHHDRLIRSWEVLRSQIHTFFVYTWSQDGATNDTHLPAWAPDHQELVDIIRRKQTSAGVDSINKHVDSAYQRVQKLFPEEDLVTA